MPEPPKITTSLAERIAKLNANVSHEKAGSGSSSSNLPGEIKSKISRYEASGQHEAPLVPKGSFGLGAPVVAPSRGLDRIRIASSGVSGGQTLVPPRSAGPSDRRSFSGQQQTQHSQRSSINSDISNSSPTGSRARHSLGPNFPTQVNDSTPSSVKSIHLAPVGPPTPGAMSMSSAQAQPGSSEPSSPLASPLATPLASHINPLDSTDIVDTDPEEARVEETRQALARFEAEENDPVARPTSGLFSSLVSSTMAIVGSTASKDEGAPIEPPPMDSNAEQTNVTTDQEETGSTTDSHEGYDGILDAYPSSSSVSGSIHDQGAPEPEFPTVKCADCGRPLSLLELSEHVCSPTREVEDETKQVPSPIRPVPADVPIDAHETGSDGDGLHGPVHDDPTSESESNDLPEEIEVSDAEEEPVVDHKPTHIITPAPATVPAEFSPIQPSPKSLDRPSPRSLEHPSLRNVSSSSPRSINLPSPRSLGPGSARHSLYDEEDEGQHEATGYATIVRRSRG